MAAETQLRQELRGYQVFFIALSAIIGGGIFTNNGEALALSGPGGYLLSIAAIGVISIMVGECVGELVQQFPVPNALMEYVRVFVDRDLAIVVGCAYWFAFSSVFAIQNLAAAGLSEYWGLAKFWQILAFYAVAPFVVWLINMLGVFIYGVVETAGGILKMTLVVAVAIILYVTAGEDHLGGAGSYINDGFQSRDGFSSGHFAAICYAIPYVAYSSLGIEIVAVTAFETKRRIDLSWPPRCIAYVTFGIYLLCAIGEALNIKWNDTRLSQIYGMGSYLDTPGLPSNPRTTNLVVMTVWSAGYKSLAGFLNGCFIFSVLSASNTSLYVSSRTLYGMTRLLPNKGLWRYSKKLSAVDRKRQVPVMALTVSGLAFIWLPFLQLKSGYSITSLIEIISVSASVSCLVAWAAICLAFIRYWYWLRICNRNDELETGFPQYCRTSEQYMPWTPLRIAQPIPAIVGFAGCLCVFVFTTATWWYSDITFKKVAIALGALIVLSLMFVILKCINRRLWVRLEPDVAILIRVLSDIHTRKVDDLTSTSRKPDQTASIATDISLHRHSHQPLHHQHDDDAAQAQRYMSGDTAVDVGVDAAAQNPNHPPPILLSQPTLPSLYPRGASRNAAGFDGLGGGPRPISPLMSGGSGTDTGSALEMDAGSGGAMYRPVSR